jgi:acyl-CoA synthetase (NDP forming)
MKLLNFDEAQKLLQDYHLPETETQIFTSLKEARASVQSLGFPLVLKIYSSSLLHRTEEGGIRKGIDNFPSFVKAWKELSPFLKKFSQAGLILQKEEKGIELATGMKRDPQFGPVIMFGLGGIFIEIFKDISLRIAPFSLKTAREMIREIKAYPLLSGFRGREPIAEEKLIDILVKLSQLSFDHPEIEEIDFNPIMADGRRVVIVDAKFLKDEKA